MKEAGQVGPTTTSGPGFVLLYMLLHPQQKPCQHFAEAAIGNNKDSNSGEEERAVVAPSELTTRLGRGTGQAHVAGGYWAARI